MLCPIPIMLFLNETEVFPPERFTLPFISIHIVFQQAPVYVGGQPQV